MDAAKLAKMLSDRNRNDLRRMEHRYSPDDVRDMVSFMREALFRELPLPDFCGKPLVLLENSIALSASAYRTLAADADSALGIASMEDEIHYTLQIESIESSRDSIRRILLGGTPKNEAESRLLGMKRGLEFIANPDNRITEENIFRLYSLAAADFLDADNRLAPGALYRHDAVYVVGTRVEHKGMAHEKLASAMAALVDFANSEDGLNDLIKASVLHFYLAYIHPYFDGNGRMARLLHMWYLVRRGWPAAMFVSFSALVNQYKAEYYKSFSAAESNAAVSGVVDATPFADFFARRVYNNLARGAARRNVSDFAAALGPDVTEKERALFEFVLTTYGDSEFSTKTLERDFGRAAYATVRAFALKFEAKGVLTSRRYANRVKYRLAR